MRLRILDLLSCNFIELNMVPNQSNLKIGKDIGICFADFDFSMFCTFSDQAVQSHMQQ